MPFWRAFSRPVTAALPIDPLYMRRLTYKMANSMHRCLPASLEMNLPMPDSSRSCRTEWVESSHLRSFALRGERGNHTIYFCELLRVTVRVNLGAMRGYVRP